MITLQQAGVAGLSRRGIQRRVETGKWDRELRGVFVLPGVPASWERDLLSVIYWLRGHAVASHRAAARLWDLPGFVDALVEVSTNKQASRKPTLSSKIPVVVHRVDWRLLPRMTRCRAIPVTTIERTIADLAALGHPRVERALDHALIRRLTSVEQMWRLADAHWMAGRRGVRVLRRLLVPRSQGLAPADSDLQIMLAKLIRDAGLPDPVREHPVALSWGTAHVDAAYPSYKLAIELDGYAWHSDRRTFERDRRRDNELRSLGWTVFRFTWGMLKFEQDNLAALIRVQLGLPRG